ncbi:MAG: hypothetical protein OEZ20_08125 [candidate division WOR-3 bacterium]|nr:hypothetical protein [candidate division WOR-3 bacterium]
MKKYLKVFSLLFLCISILVVGCKKETDDEEAIIEILKGSVYTDEDQSRAFEDNDTIPTPGAMAAMAFSPDTMVIPWVKFARKVIWFTRHVSVEIKDTTAIATIGTSADGYFIVVNDPVNPERYRRTLTDTGIRTVYLTKSDGRWRIRKISPKNIWTKDALLPITITNLRAEARPSRTVFEINRPDTLLTKDQLPTFQPDDTVKVTVTIQMDDDSAWVFLHRGRKRPHRHRKPFLRTSTYTFEREWVISSDTDTPHTMPEVRPCAIDAIQWQTLWGDSSAPYNCRAWALPYVVKLPDESYPDSE